MNEITMKMQADQLIRMALQEDITSEDVSTNAVMPTATKGTVELIAKEDGVIAGLDIYARVFTILDEKTEIDFTEDVTAKKVLMKPFVKAYLKKQQARYVKDLARKLKGNYE